MPKKPVHSNMEELISCMFIMGRALHNKLHKNTGAGQYSMLEFETMKYVKDAGQPHMRDVAKNFHVTPPAATLLIESLVKAKLLARVLDPDDRRSVRVSLTPKGKKLLEQGIAKKVGEDGDKAELAKISVGIKFDLTNMGMLKVDMALDVAPYKLRLPASVEEDLAQMKLDFAAGTIEHCAPEVVEHGEPGPVGDGGEAGDETQSGGESGED